MLTTGDHVLLALGAIGLIGTAVTAYGLVLLAVQKYRDRQDDQP